MEKIAVGPGYPAGIINLDAPAIENIMAVAKAKGVPINEITACIMDRPRHARLIEEVRATGAAIRLIGDGDVAGVIHTTDPDETGIDIYIGIGGAPEGVLAAAALRCIGGQMQGRLQLNSDDKIARAAKMGISDPKKIYTMEEMAKGDVLFAATGVTDGNMLSGVKFARDYIQTHTVVHAFPFADGPRNQGEASGYGEVPVGTSFRPPRLPVRKSRQFYFKPVY